MPVVVAAKLDCYTYSDSSGLIGCSYCRVRIAGMVVVVEDMVEDVVEDIVEDIDEDKAVVGLDKGVLHKVAGVVGDKHWMGPSSIGPLMDVAVDIAGPTRVADVVVAVEVCHRQTELILDLTVEAEIPSIEILCGKRGQEALKTELGL